MTIDHLPERVVTIFHDEYEDSRSRQRQKDGDQLLNHTKLIAWWIFPV